jgi:SOS response regulatory protein OraA/RecX
MKGEPEEKLMDYAVRLVSRSEYTRRQVMLKLISRGTGEELARKICDELQSSGLIDDPRYCDLFISTHPDLGFRRMRMELLRRGIDRTLVERKVCFDSESEIARASEMVRHWCGSLEERKITGRLLRRGFSDPVIREAIRRACDRAY